MKREEIVELMEKAEASRGDLKAVIGPGNSALRCPNGRRTQEPKTLTFLADARDMVLTLGKALLTAEDKLAAPAAPAPVKDETPEDCSVQQALEENITRLEAEVAELKKLNTSLKGQVTKLKKKADKNG